MSSRTSQLATIIWAWLRRSWSGGATASALAMAYAAIVMYLEPGRWMLIPLVGVVAWIVLKWYDKDNRYMRMAHVCLGAGVMGGFSLVARAVHVPLQGSAAELVLGSGWVPLVAGLAGMAFFGWLDFKHHHPSLPPASAGANAPTPPASGPQQTVAAPNHSPVIQVTSPSAPVTIVTGASASPDLLSRLDALLKSPNTGSSSTAKGNLAAAKIAPNQFFTGRTDELARLHSMLAGGSVAIVLALTGEGGIGKTELAKVYALIYADTYDSAWWLDASSAALRGELVKVYERATGEQAPQNAPTDLLCDALVAKWKGTRPLIILDNVDDPANFTLFSALPTARILATTRQHHKTLAGVEPFALGVLRIADAVVLMRKEIANNRADVTDADLTAIATELGGHALAVALAGAYLANFPDVPAAQSTTTTRSVLDRLRQSGVGDVQPVTDGGEHDALGLSYQRSVAASLSLHFASEKVKPALPVLAAAAFLHPTGITVEWLAKGTGQSEDAVRAALKTLDTYSIVKYDKTVSLHRLTQGVARSRADVAGGEAGEATVERLFTAFHALHEEDDHDQIRPLRTAAALHIEAACNAALATPSLASTHWDAAVCHRKNADHFQLIGDLSSADRSISKAVAWAESQGEGIKRDLMVFHSSRASIRQLRGLLKEAEEDIKKSIDWGEAQSPRDERTPPPAPPAPQTPLTVPVPSSTPLMFGPLPISTLPTIRHGSSGRIE